MHIWLRRSLAGLFIIIFLVGFLPLIFITSGRLYNSKKHTFEETTLLILESKPKGAQIQLNGESPKNWWTPYVAIKRNKVFRTPNRLNYLLPDTYEISITHDSYYDWSQTLTLEPGKSTIIDDIKLWPHVEPIPVLSETTKRASLSPSQNYIAYLSSEKEVVIFDVDNQEIKERHSLISTTTALYWAPNEDALVVSSDEATSLIVRDSQTFLPLPFKRTMDEFQWVGSTIYAINADGIEIYDTVNQSYVERTGDFVDWDIQDTTLWILEKKALTINSNAGTLKKSISAPPSKTFSKILFQDAVWLYVSTNSGTTLRLHKPSEQWHELSPNYVEGISIVSSKNTALWWNEFEIGTLLLSTNKSIVLSRLSGSLQKLFLDSSYDNNHHIAVTDDSVFALDRLPLGGFQSQELFKLDGIVDSVFDESKNRLILTTVTDEDVIQFWIYPTILEK